MNSSRGSAHRNDTLHSKFDDYSDDEDCCEMEKGCVRLRKCCYCITLRVGAFIVAFFTVSLCISLLSLHGVALYWITTTEKEFIAAGRSPDPYVGVKVVMALGIVVFALWIILSALMALAAQRKGLPVLMSWVYYSIIAKIFCFAISMYCAAIHDQFFESGYNTASFVLWLLMIPFWVYFDFVVYSLKQQINDKKRSLTLTGGAQALHEPETELNDWEGLREFSSKERLGSADPSVRPPMQKPQPQLTYDPDEPLTGRKRGSRGSRGEVNHLYKPDEPSARGREPRSRGENAFGSSEVQSMRREQTLDKSMNPSDVLMRDKSRSRWGRPASAERPEAEARVEDDPRRLKRMSSFHQEEEESPNDNWRQVDARTRESQLPPPPQEWLPENDSAENEVQRRPRQNQRPVPAKRRSLSQERGKTGSRQRVGEASTDEDGGMRRWQSGDSGQLGSRNSLSSPSVHYAESTVYPGAPGGTVSLEPPPADQRQWDVAGQSTPHQPRKISEAAKEQFKQPSLSVTSAGSADVKYDELRRSVQEIPPVADVEELDNMSDYYGTDDSFDDVSADESEDNLTEAPALPFRNSRPTPRPRSSLSSSGGEPTAGSQLQEAVYSNLPAEYQRDVQGKPAYGNIAADIGVRRPWQGKGRVETKPVVEPHPAGGPMPYGGSLSGRWSESEPSEAGTWDERGTRMSDEPLDGYGVGLRPGHTHLRLAAASRVSPPGTEGSLATVDRDSISTAESGSYYLPRGPGRGESLESFDDSSEYGENYHRYGGGTALDPTYPSGRKPRPSRPGLGLASLPAEDELEPLPLSSRDKYGTTASLISEPGSQYEARVSLEARHRAEEEEMYRGFSDIRERNRKHLEQALRAESQRAMRAFDASLSQQELRSSQELLSGGELSAAGREQLRQRAEQSLGDIMKDEQRRIEKLVERQTSEMLRLVHTKDGEEEVVNEIPEVRPPNQKKSDLIKSALVFREVDTHTEKVAATDFTSFTQLIQRLTKRCQSDLERLRAIFKWICVKPLDRMTFEEVQNPDSPMGMLKQIKYGTGCYHTLFKRLCSFAGLHVDVVHGYSKGAGFRPGMRVNERRFRNSWTAVCLDSQWRFVNCNWGARHTKSEKSDSKNFIYKYDEFYFLTDPEDHIFQHFPDDPKWQLLTLPITLDEFCRLPMVKSPFFNSGLRFSHKYSAALPADTGRAELILWRGGYVGVSAALAPATDSSGKKIVPNATLVRIYDKSVVINCSVPRRGLFFLNVFVSSDWRSSSMDLACSFLIRTADNQKLEKARYPPIPFFGQTPVLKDCGMSLLSHNDPLVATNSGELSVRLHAPRAARFAHALHYWERSKQQLVESRGSTLLQHWDEALSIQMRCNKRGFYVLSLFAVPPGAKAAEHECAYRYLVAARAAAADGMPFPVMKRKWTDGCRLQEPLNGYLPAGEEISFELHVPRAIAVALYVEKHWHELRMRDEHTWYGRAKLPARPQKLGVYARLDRASSSFSPLLEYQLRNSLAEAQIRVLPKM